MLVARPFVLSSLIVVVLALPACRGKSSEATHDASPTASSSASVVKSSPERLAARAKAHCARQDSWTKLESKECQACMRGDGKGARECKPQAAPLRECLKALASATKTETAPCVMACGKDCGCTMGCYEKGMGDCYEPFLSQIACVSVACDEICR